MANKKHDTQRDIDTENSNDAYKSGGTNKSASFPKGCVNRYK